MLIRSWPIALRRRLKESSLEFVIIAICKPGTSSEISDILSGIHGCKKIIEWDISSGLICLDGFKGIVMLFDVPLNSLKNASQHAHIFERNQSINRFVTGKP